MFAKPLMESGVEWMITGGVAAIVYGEPRFTQDLDVVTALTADQAGAFAACFPDNDFYCPPVEVIAAESARDRFGHFNLLHLETDGRADVYIAGTDSLARRGLEQRRMISIGGRVLPLAAPEYVILHKLRFRQQGATERHLRDVRAMLRVLGNTVDHAQLRREADAEGLAEQWQEMERLDD